MLRHKNFKIRLQDINLRVDSKSDISFEIKNTTWPEKIGKRQTLEF